MSPCRLNPSGGECTWPGLDRRHRRRQWGWEEHEVARLRADPVFAEAEFLDPDRIAATIKAGRPNLGPRALNFAGLRDVAKKIDFLLSARQPFLAETVLANHAYRRICRIAQSRGTRVRLVFLGVPTVEDAIARVALRVSKGGHDVPEADIRRRWPRAHENLAWFAQHADAIDVFANSWNSPPALVAQARHGRVTLLDYAALPAVSCTLQPLI